MKTKELEERIEKMMAKEQFVTLRNWLYDTFEVYYKQGENYTNSSNAAMYDRNGSCKNSYLKCEDGFVSDPF